MNGETEHNTQNLDMEEPVSAGVEVSVSTESEISSELDAPEPNSVNMADKDDRKNKKKNKKKKKGVPLIAVVILVVVFFIGGTVFGSVALLNLTASATGLNTTGIMKKLTILNTCVKQYFLDDYKESSLEDGIYSGFMNALGDPYSCYYSADEYKQLMDEDSGEYKGIGVTVTKNADNNYAEVMSVFKDDPAYKAGVETGDFITKVDGEDTSAMTLTEVVSAIKKTDDPVKLTIYRDGEEMEITVDKDTISVDSVTYEMKDKKNKIGYISVSQFLENTDEQFIDAVDDLQSQGMKGLIIDLRDDGGGLLDSCVNMISRIIPKDDLIVYTEDKNGNRNDYDSNSDQTLEVPIVLLVNENTASASEIMTGCLKDYELATVIGTKTFGKGIVQSILPLSDGSAIKLTVSAYYTPNGVNIHKKGIEPDIEMEMTDDEWKAAQKDPSKDAQIKRALKVLTDSESK